MLYFLQNANVTFKYDYFGDVILQEYIFVIIVVID